MYCCSYRYTVTGSSDTNKVVFHPTFGPSSVNRCRTTVTSTAIDGCLGTHAGCDIASAASAIAITPTGVNNGGVGWVRGRVPQYLPGVYVLVNTFKI